MWRRHILDFRPTVWFNTVYILPVNGCALLNSFVATHMSSYPEVCGIFEPSYICVLFNVKSTASILSHCRLHHIRWRCPVVILPVFKLHTLQVVSALQQSWWGKIGSQRLCPALPCTLWGCSPVEYMKCLTISFRQETRYLVVKFQHAEIFCRHKRQSKEFAVSVYIGAPV